MHDLVPYVIGDIHGCYLELLELEKLAKLHNKGKQPFFICVGDLIDRGPDSKKVVEHFRQGALNGTHLSVLGNHEIELLRILLYEYPDLFKKINPTSTVLGAIATVGDDFFHNRRGAHLFTDTANYAHAMKLSWYTQGGYDTLSSYGLLSANNIDFSSFPISHLDYLCSLPLYFENDDLIVTHALPTRSDLETLKQYQEKSLKKEELTPASILASKEAAFACTWNRNKTAEILDEKKYHLSGHTPLEEIFIHHELKYIQIDTGCVYGNKLTAYCLKDHSHVQINSKTTWNPAHT